MLIFIRNIPGKICRQWVAMVAAEREMIGLGQRLTFYHISFQIIFFNLLNIFFNHLNKFSEYSYFDSILGENVIATLILQCYEVVQGDW